MTQQACEVIPQPDKSPGMPAGWLYTRVNDFTSRMNALAHLADNYTCPVDGFATQVKAFASYVKAFV
jgi:hypothetical protein